MTSSHIRKNLIRQISQFGSQNFTKLLQQKINPEPRLDAQAFRQTISILKHTAAHNGLISLSAPQIYFRHRIFVILKKSLIKYGKWNGYQSLFSNKKPEDCYDAIINPQLVGYSNFKIKGDEQCSSIEGLKFKVWIPLVNRMNFVKYTEQLERSKSKPVFQNCQQQFTGFYGRVFDHEYRHLQGLLPNLPQICNDEVYLTDDSKQNPENYNFIRNYRLQREYFSDQNIDKQLEQQKKRMNEQKMQKKQPSISQTINFDKLPDKIDDKLRQKLTKAYEAARDAQPLGNKMKSSSGFQSLAEPNKKQSKRSSKAKSHKTNNNKK